MQDFFFSIKKIITVLTRLNARSSETIRNLSTAHYDITFIALCKSDVRGRIIRLSVHYYSAKLCEAKTEKPYTTCQRRLPENVNYFTHFTTYTKSSVGHITHVPVVLLTFAKKKKKNKEHRVLPVPLLRLLYTIR